MRRSGGRRGERRGERRGAGQDNRYVSSVLEDKYKVQHGEEVKESKWEGVRGFLERGRRRGRDGGGRVAWRTKRLQRVQQQEAAGSVGVSGDKDRRSVEGDA